MSDIQLEDTASEQPALDRKLAEMKREHQAILDRAQRRAALEKELWIMLMRAHSAEGIMGVSPGVDPPTLCHDCLTPPDRCPLNQVTLAHDAVVTQCVEFDGAKGGGE